jgi:hypothetical protein
MKLSEQTNLILRNFSTINPSILVKKGKVLKTMSPVKTVFTVANIDEEFPMDFAIYDLNKFIGALGLFASPELTFEPSYVTISEGKQKVRIKYADPSVIVAPPDKDIKVKTQDVQFHIESSNLQRILRSLGVLGLTEVAMVGEEGVVYLQSINSKTNETGSDSFSIEVGETTKNFQANFKSENLKFMNKDYDVTLSFTGIAEFKSDNITYYIPCEATSKF